MVQAARESVNESTRKTASRSREHRDTLDLDIETH
jgi:hypothetical protein